MRGVDGVRDLKFAAASGVIEVAHLNRRPRGRVQSQTFELMKSDERRPGRAHGVVSAAAVVDVQRGALEQVQETARDERAGCDGHAERKIDDDLDLLNRPGRTREGSPLGLRRKTGHRQIEFRPADDFFASLKEHNFLEGLRGVTAQSQEALRFFQEEIGARIQDVKPVASAINMITTTTMAVLKMRPGWSADFTMAVGESMICVWSVELLTAPNVNYLPDCN